MAVQKGEVSWREGMMSTFVAIWLVTNTFSLLEFFQNFPELKRPVAHKDPLYLQLG